MGFISAANLFLVSLLLLLVVVDADDVECEGSLSLAVLEDEEDEVDIVNDEEKLFNLVGVHEDGIWLL